MLSRYTYHNGSLLKALQCKYCGSKNTVKSGKRKLKAQSTKQTYFCKACKRKFSNNNKTNKRTNPKIILKALTLYCQGCTLENILFIIKKRYNVERTKSALSKWIREYSPRYLQIRHINKNFRKIIENHIFQHNNINYNYRCHIPKLSLFCKYKGLKGYLTNMPKSISNEIFNTSKRCSQLKLSLNIEPKSCKNTWLSAQLQPILDFAKSSKSRHEVVETYLLSCDRDTIATEVPVYYYDKKLGSISGHIDILQSKNSKIYILDYKPEAEKENKKKVATQLNLYALALSFRANIPLNDIVCAYFDENNYFEFKPRYSLPYQYNQ